MSAVPEETQPDYPPPVIDVYLSRYREIAAALASGNIRAITYTPDLIKRSRNPDPHWLAHTKADLDRALLWLAQLDHDPLAAMYCQDHYVDGISTADLADRDGVAQRTIQGYIQRGRTQLAQRLGWRELDGDDCP